MIYLIASHFQLFVPALNVVHYVTFRAIVGLLSTLFWFWLFGDTFLAYSQRLFRSPVRDWTPEAHRAKDNSPTMGGLFIVTTAVLNILLWCDLSQGLVWLFLASFLGFAAIGAWDDWQKIRRQGGLSVRVKLALQLLVAGLVAAAWWAIGGSTVLAVPFLKQLTVDLGLLFIPWAVLVLVGCSNGVNVTDGLDGLAIGSLIPNFATFAVICYAAGHAKIATYLCIPFTGSAELAVIGGILVGASLGFLWYNAYPAQIFMGDVGSLALGAALGTMALASGQTVLLVISGGLFVVETLSVIVQVLSYKYFGRRVFRMAPLHHHFELKGWPEARITMRFVIISIVLCLLALITLKIR